MGSFTRYFKAGASMQLYLFDPKLVILSPYQTQENFEVENFELDAFIDVCNEEEVKTKQGKNRMTKRPQSSRARDIDYHANIHVRLERRNLIHTHPLEINFTHNHVINSAESLSFRRVKDEVKEKLVELFKDGHSPTSALFTYEDELSYNGEDEEILYASSSLEMDTHYREFAQTFYYFYPLLRNHFEILWERRQFWAHSFRVGLPIRGNHTNNYIERSFGILKDIIFARTQAYNLVQVFHFIVTSMEIFYERSYLELHINILDTYALQNDFYAQ
ncbi:16243_t:CDS:2, partial [Funneliformis caledonium]